MKERAKELAADLLAIMRGPAVWSHPATWACLAAGALLGGACGVLLGKLLTGS